MIDFSKSKPNSNNIFNNNGTSNKFSSSQQFAASPTHSTHTKSKGPISENFKKFTMKLPARRSYGIFKNSDNAKVGTSIKEILNHRRKRSSLTRFELSKFYKF